MADVEDCVASANNPDPAFQTIDKTAIKITKVRRAKVSWQGDEQLGLGALTTPIMRDQYTQAMRSLVNEMERDIAQEVVAGALAKGNFVGTAGTTPFASNLNDLTLAYKKLSDNGCPTSDLQMVLNTSAGMNLRNLTQLQKVNESGDGSLLRQGVLGQLFGFNLRESAGFKAHDKGAGTGYLVNGEAKKGSFFVNVDTGSGAVKKGDIIHFGSDVDHKYIVAEDDSAPTSIKLTSELVADVADDAVITIENGYLASAGFARGSVLLATRLPAVPIGGDSAIDRAIITDPVSGISFEVAVWGGSYQNTITFANAWGVKNIKGEHSVALLG